VNAYLEAMKAAKLARLYVPELEDCYYRDDDFRSPRWFVYEAH